MYGVFFFLIVFFFFFPSRKIHFNVVEFFTRIINTFIKNITVECIILKIINLMNL